MVNKATPMRPRRSAARPDAALVRPATVAAAAVLRKSRLFSMEVPGVRGWSAQSAGPRSGMIEASLLCEDLHDHELHDLVAG